MNNSRLANWQALTATMLLVGYTGYYFCRSNLSAAGPLILDEFAGQGMDKERFGIILTVGTGFYAGGKLVNGALCDFIGGRAMFLLGMVGSVVATVLFGLGGGLAVFIAAWALNRFVQSGGWGAVVKVSSNWFSIQSHGRVMGILCLSYLFGDALARAAFGGLIERGMGWRGLFFTPAALLAAIAVACWFALRSSPRDVGAEEPSANPANLYGQRGNSSRPEGLLELLLPFFRSPSFWIICAMSLGLTLIRETFRDWTPVYLSEAAEARPGIAALGSMVFPLSGGFSALFAGYVTDRIAHGRRGVVMLAFLVPLAAALTTLCWLSSREQPPGLLLPLLLISVVGMAMTGPYSFLTGVFSLDLGGKQGSASAAGLVDSAGYFGGMLAGWGVGKIAQDVGWGAVFAVLAAVAAATALAAGVFWWLVERRAVAEMQAQEKADAGIPQS